MRVIVLMLSDGHQPTPGPLAASMLPNPREILPVALRGLGAVERRVNPIEGSVIGSAGRIHVG